MSLATDLPASLPSVSLFGGLIAAFGNFCAAQEAARDYERLSRQTDAALAAQGLRREDLPRLLLERHFR